MCLFYTLIQQESCTIRRMLQKSSAVHERRIRVPSGDTDRTTPPRSPQRLTCHRQIPTASQNLPVIKYVKTKAVNNH